MEKTAQAKLKNLRQSPRKVRLVADLLRGKRVDEALINLRMLNKKASVPIKKLLDSAVANAKNLSINPENLFVKKITVDQGPILYRRRYRARGSSTAIRKRTSDLNLVLAEQQQKSPKNKVRSSGGVKMSDDKSKETKSV